MTLKEKLSWGVLGAAGIAKLRMIPAIQESESGRVAALASRSADKATEVAKQFGVERAYGSYDELLADQDIDAIYIPLPNSMHCEWSIKALQAGKHVLCEKPLAISADECRRMVEAAGRSNRLLIEAFWYRHHPQNHLVREAIAEGKLGELRVVRAYHHGNVTDPATNVRMKSELAGGTLVDNGPYPVNLCRWLFGKEPRAVSAFFEFDPVYKVDVSFSGLLDFGPSQVGIVDTGFKHAYKHRYEVIGDRGYVVADRFLVHADMTATLRFSIDGQVSERQIPPTNAFVRQVDAFAACLRDGAESLTPAEDAIKNLTVIEALYQSGREGRHVPIPGIR